MSSDIRLEPPEPPTATAASPLHGATGSDRANFRNSGPATEDLARRLFQAPERWGWEYVEPAPMALCPEQRPQWVEPLGPDLRALEEKLRLAKAKMPKRLIWAGVLGFIGLTFMGLSVGFGLLLLLIGAGIGGFAVYESNNAETEIRRARSAAADRRRAAQSQFNELTRAWDERAKQHEAAEQKRYADAPVLFPVAPSGHASRVDVFGGTAIGWAALLTTMGSSVMSAGAPAMVVDLTSQDVAGPLEDLARTIGAPTQSASVPAALETPWLLGDLTPRELADVLAEAMEANRSARDNALGAMDADIIYSVARHLARPLTFDRLTAGVQVLRATYEHGAESVLSAAEVQTLTERVDQLDKGERVRNELQFIESQLSILGESERRAQLDKATATTLWPRSGLAVIRNDEPSQRRKDFIDQVLIQALSHHLLSTRTAAADPMLVVAGADLLGRPSLEQLARNAFRARVRLVLLFEHLRDDAEHLLGGGDSVALLMRMGNHTEAAKAAEYVGRGYTFQVSQLSRQVGTNSSRTRNWGTTETVGQAVSETRGGSRHDSNWSRGVTDSWSTARTQGESFTEGESQTDGVTVQRSYEFTVEPTQFQNLDPTIFIVVDSDANGRRVRTADCYPGSVYVPKISPTPR